MNDVFLIQVTENGQITGHLTCEQFRNQIGSKTDFIGNLVKKFNDHKKSINSDIRVEQIINKKSKKIRK